MTYNFVTDKLEVRSSTDKQNPRYVVNGYALVPDTFDSYGYEWDNKGNVKKAFNSMFTKNCIESIKKQSQFKKLFVDTKHELFHNSNIKSILKGKVSPVEEKKIDEFLKSKMLPLAKLTDITIDDKGLFIETELNPAFRNLDESHQRYFDAVWSSLENKYLNGISINFIPTDVVKDGKGREVINDVDIAGFSFVDRPSLPEHNIAEVAIRSAQDFIKNQEVDVKMEEEKKKFEEEKAKLAEDKKTFEEEQAKIKKEKEDAAAESKKKSIDEQKAEHEKLKKDLEEKNEALKKAAEEKKEMEEKMNSGKGVVKDIDNPNQVKKTIETNDSVYVDNLKKITEKHDETIKLIKSGKQPMIDNTMSGFAEAINLGHQAGNPTADLSEQDAAFVKEHRLLDKGGSDLVAPRREKI